MQDKPVFEEILAPTDGSPASEDALELTAFIAKQFKSKVTVIHVVAHELMHPDLKRFFPENREYYEQTYSDSRVPLITHLHEPVTTLQEKAFQEVSTWYREHGEEVMADALAVFKEANVQVDKKLIEDADPAESIIQESEKESYRLIVMGRNDEEQPDSRLGSIAKRVSLHAKIPVLIAGHNKQISKLLVPIDGSRNTETTLNYASSIAEKTGAKITLLYVQEPGLFRLRPRVAEGIGTSVLANAAAQIEATKPGQKLESGDPAKTIVKTADDGDYDLIIIGSHGHSSTRRFFLGSVADHVIHYANRSVLLTR